MVYLEGNLTGTLWTTAQAAGAAGVTRDVIYTWAHRGKLKPVNRRGWPRYRASDVLRVQAETQNRNGCQLQSAA
ncbi:MerR family transcriptional regulator [Kitasatospora sp. NBC_00240]|uniref:MerR family transcriptional regulator n=1 Tax=Kitasatospora sp. NBC_00240 TaxID=2903567 RepID=UPI002253D48D|nr:MerR family transcriptional regulator [Kitasatospora sp. NBC_00240]MCX5209804.1 MerR family transcriptional regulator [Kitasatospora sp. NBC_00240]